MLILLNPAAGGGRAKRLAGPLSAALAAQGGGHTLAVARSVDHGLALIDAQPPGGRVVIVGGDGTVNRCLPALLRARQELALVPCGSGNDLARALGVHGWHWRTALALALAGATRRLDVGWCDATPFISSLAAGFDAAVARRALEGPSWPGGMPRYLIAIAREIAGLRCHRVRAIADGAVVHDDEVLFTSVLNTPTYGSGMPVAPGARMDDGVLELVIVRRLGRLQTLALLPRLLRGSHLGDPRVRLLRVAGVVLESAGTITHAADGEVLAPASRIEVRVAPGALAVVVP